MPGPRKVRIFKDPKKSPNWYVEWRDFSGRRHCESCGPRQDDAIKRSRQINDELRHSRLADARGAVQLDPKPPRSEAPITRSENRGESLPSILRVRAILKSPQFELPVDLHVELNPDLIDAVSQLLPK
jgi:hypothetical protein